MCSMIGGIPRQLEEEHELHGSKGFWKCLKVEPLETSENTFLGGSKCWEWLVVPSSASFIQRLPSPNTHCSLQGLYWWWLWAWAKAAGVCWTELSPSPITGSHSQVPCVCVCVCARVCVCGCAWICTGSKGSQPWYCTLFISPVSL